MHSLTCSLSVRMRTAWWPLAARRARSPPQRGAAYPCAPLRSFRSAPRPAANPAAPDNAWDVAALLPFGDGRARARRGPASRRRRSSPRSTSPACSWSSSATAALMSLRRGAARARREPRARRGLHRVAADLPRSTSPACSSSSATAALMSAAARPELGAACTTSPPFAGLSAPRRRRSPLRACWRACSWSSSATAAMMSLRRGAARARRPPR